MSDDIKILPELFMNLNKLYKERPFVKFRNPEGKWIGISGEEAQRKIYSLAAGLLSLGLNKGDKIALISETRYEWTLIDFAIEILGMVNVPIYPSLNGDQTTILIEHSDAKALIVENEHLLNKCMEFKDRLKNISSCIEIDRKSDEQNETISYEKLAEMGEEKIKTEGKEQIKELMSSINEDTLASILYTSGTTGAPKGVMLSHKNFISNGWGAYYGLELTKYKTTLVFLPLSHAYARTCNYAMMLCSLTLYYAVNTGTIGRDMVETSPDFVIGVPRVWEKVYDKIEYNATKEGGIKKLIFNWAKNVAIKSAMHLQEHKNLPITLKIQYNIADKLVYGKIKEKTGGNLKFIQSGSSALAKYISYFFTGIGINAVEGYGLTEASPIVSSNVPSNPRIGTVGKPFMDVQVKKAEDKELLVKGPNVMLGYYKNEEDTKEVITPDGWLKTGDLCEIDEDNYIKIIERKKDLFKTTNGKYIVPQKIESLGKQNNYIEEIVVIADNKKFASALILPAFDYLKEYAKNEDIQYKDNEELINNDKIYNLYKEIVNDDINSKLANYESIKRFTLIKDPFTIENGGLTPTYKVKRKFVENKYNDKIIAMYHNK